MAMTVEMAKAAGGKLAKLESWGKTQAAEAMRREFRRRVEAEPEAKRAGLKRAFRRAYEAGR